MTPPRLTIIAVAGEAGLALTAGLRREVFLDEQGVPADLEWDADDAVALHYLATCATDGVVAVASFDVTTVPAESVVISR